MIVVNSLSEYRPLRGDRFTRCEEIPPSEQDSWVCCQLTPGRKSRELQRQGKLPRLHLPALVLVPVVGRIS